MRVAMMVTNDVRLDSRVRREAGTLIRAGYEVTVYGVMTPATASEPSEMTPEGFDIIRLPMMTTPVRLPDRPSSGATASGSKRSAIAVAAAVFQYTRPLLGGTLHFAVNWQFRWSRWGRRVAAIAAPADVWHAHDLNSLPAAFACARRHGGKVVYDSHEIFTEAGATARLPGIIRRAIRWQERRWSARCDAFITVNQAVADILVPALSPRTVLVLHNCTEPRADGARTTLLRDAVGADANAPLLLYHGSVVEHRGLRELIRAMRLSQLQTTQLAIMGYGTLRPELEAMVQESRLGDRVHFLPPVPPSELVAWVTGADVAVMPIQPSTLNHRLSTPNKLFEALAAGVPVVGPDFSMFARVVNDPNFGQLGRLCDPYDPSSIARSVADILALDGAQSRDLRRRCLAAAASRWNWSTESRQLIDLYRSLSVRSVEVQPAEAVRPIPPYLPPAQPIAGNGNRISPHSGQ